MEALAGLANIRRLVAQEQEEEEQGRGAQEGESGESEVDPSGLGFASVLAGLKDAKDLHVNLMRAAAEGQDEQVRELLHRQAHTSSRRAVTPPL